MAESLKPAAGHHRRLMHVECITAPTNRAAVSLSARRSQVDAFELHQGGERLGALVNDG